MNSNHQHSLPSMVERLIAIANYITCGIVGFVWLILVALRRVKLSPFLQFHIFQTFFIVMLYWLLSVFISLITQILSFIPFINILVLKLLFYFNAPFIFGTYSIVSGSVLLIMIYLCLTTLQGQYSYLPIISDIIAQNIRR